MVSRAEGLTRCSCRPLFAYSYVCPDGPAPFPEPRMAGAQGIAILTKIAENFGKRPHTLIHGGCTVPTALPWQDECARRLQTTT